MRFMGVSVEVHFYCKKVAHQKKNFLLLQNVFSISIKVWMGFTPSFFSAKNTIGWVNVYNEFVKLNHWIELNWIWLHRFLFTNVFLGKRINNTHKTCHNLKMKAHFKKNTFWIWKHVFEKVKSNSCINLSSQVWTCCGLFYTDSKKDT